MSKKNRPWVVDYAVYLLVRLLISVFQGLPVASALNFARFAARLTYRIDRRHRLVAADNLRHAFPHLDEFEVDQMIRYTYKHLYEMVMEVAMLPRKLHRSTLRKYVHHVDQADYHRCLSWGFSSRPTLTVTGHFGSWEALNFALGLEGMRATVIARALDNRYLDRYVRQLRGRTGMEMVDKNGSMEDVVATLARGGNVGLVVDQDAGPRGLFVNFFGRPASTFKSIALLAMEYRAVILVAGCVRGGAPLHYQLSLEDEILTEDYLDDPDAVRKITERFTAALERMVRRHPGQYFWLHRRWKSQPKRRARDYSQSPLPQAA